ncbi:MAG: hypothetical protein JJ900_08440 [Rhodospirillales bacterium]|nr:hypothetical protein [Rhodospirillales bacterium]MBO6786866.1 hypothetical protein [Rhodospirillales bacterium]
MDMKDFVRETLSQIKAGLCEFEDDSEDGFTVVPTLSGTTDTSKWAQQNLIYTGRGENGEMQYATIVEFDVAVTAEEKSEAGAAAKAEVKVFSAFSGSVKGGKSGETTDTTASRIRFKVPMQIKFSETVKQSPRTRRVVTRQ